MRMPGRLWLIALTPMLAGAASAETCAETENRIEVQLSQLRVVASPASAMRGLGTEALRATAACQDSARLWFLAARSAELLEPRPEETPLAIGGDAPSITRDALAHIPQSAALATVAARLQGDVASARRAHALDPDYRPARRALAIALSGDGDTAGALALIGEAKDSPSRITRARILLNGSRAAAGVVEARAVLAGHLIDPDEPNLRLNMHRDANEILGLSLVALHKRKLAEEPLRQAAALGSEAAQQALAAKP